MRLAFIIAILACLGFGAPARGEFRAGLEAYYRLDYVTALKEWRPLASQGDPRAQYQLGVLHYRGEGVPQDFTTAAKWFEMAAEQGDPDAQFNLGLMAANGQGVPQDLVRAYMWFTLAVSTYKDGGRQDWAVNDTAWAASSMARTASRMTAEQIARANRLALAWRGRHGF